MNVRGDVVQRVNDAGAVLRSYRYSAFGVELNYVASNTNPFRWGLMYWDSETATYMTPNRHMNPRTGRWNRPDPHWHTGNMIFGCASSRGSTFREGMPYTNAILQSGNLYVFGINNPIMFHDPSGGFIIKAIIIGAIIGSVISGGADIVTQKIKGRSWSEIDWQSVAISAGSGALSGGLAGSPLGLGWIIAGNAAVSGGTSVVRQTMQGNDINWSRVAIDTGIGALAGRVGGPGATHGARTVSYHVVNASNLYHSVVRIEHIGVTAARTAYAELRRNIVRAAGTEVAIYLVDNVIYIMQEAVERAVR